MHIIFEKALRLWIQYMLMLRALYRGFLIGFLPQYSSFLLQYPLLFWYVSVFLVRRTIWLDQIYLKWLLTSFLDNLVSEHVRLYDFCFSNGSLLDGVSLSSDIIPLLHATWGLQAEVWVWIGIVAFSGMLKNSLTPIRAKKCYSGGHYHLARHLLWIVSGCQRILYVACVIQAIYSKQVGREYGKEAGMPDCLGHSDTCGHLLANYLLYPWKKLKTYN